MNIDYSPAILELFNAPKYFFDEKAYTVIGFAGDLNIGEILNLYLNIAPNENYVLSQITKVRYSALGSVMLIAAAENFCAKVEGKTLQDALNYCDPSTGLHYALNAPNDRLHSVNFVVQAFYNAFENFIKNMIV